ncbi:hypothetical protein BZB76_6408 [Actinomadura pelletieri DSM 43383]|uniref:TfdA family taurine catabolism dioxygenase TauD n=1 Tax=Actinomadura pelletieri DSM 43383 TaxID=1120940 RepID=A0A495Q9K0_9ACTN|nr:hypothetical protein [Actinomadura pelletieri]RKS68160.1 hypothetical protein BZB76_6408 [Actinomadura pelletieri DSM 43383]
MTGLRRGFGVNLLADSCTQDRVEISSGVRPLDGAASQPAAPGAVVARDDWRPLRPDEAAVLFPGEPVSLASSVSVTDFGEDMVKEAHERLLPGVGAGTDTGHDQQAALRDFQEKILGLLYERQGLVPESLGAVDVVVHRPDQLSTGFNEGLNGYMGLHIDSHQRLPFAQCAGAMTLCSVNVGFTDRYLNFVNLPVRNLLAMLAERGEPVPESSIALKDTFFRLFPEYPVLRVRLAPGQAYLCNTQNTIHDGATNDQGLPDVSLLTINGLPDSVPRRAVALA